VNVFHKNFGVHRRQRQGYSDDLDVTHRNIRTVTEFINSEDPIKMLSELTGFRFDEECQIFYKSSLTTVEIKECLSDLKVLGKSDFKSLINWRLKMQEIRDAAAKAAGGDGEEGDEEEDENEDKTKNGRYIDSDDEEDHIQKQIARAQETKLRAKKREVKKEREKAAKLRQRHIYGMDHNAIELPDAQEGESVFSLATIKSKGDLARVQEVELKRETGGMMDGDNNDDGQRSEDDVSESDEDSDEDNVDQTTGYSYKLEREMDEAYDVYIKKTKNSEHKSTSKMAKRSKKFMRTKASEEALQDIDMMSNDALAYSSLLNDGEKKHDGEGGYLIDSDDDDESSSSEEEDDDDDDEEEVEKVEVEVEEKKKQQKTKTKIKMNPLIHIVDKPGDARAVKAQRWFSNPLFDSVMGEEEEEQDEEDDEEEDSENSSDDDEQSLVSEPDDEDDEDEAPKKKQKRNGTSVAEEVLRNMPKTDKELRHEKRLKAIERKDRKQNKRAKENGEGIEIVATNSNDNNDLDGEDEDGGVNKADLALEGMTEKQRKRVLEARELIKAGMAGVKGKAGNGKGGGSGNGNGEEEGFTVAPADPDALPIYDERKYDSDNEEYDSDDHAETLALGTMMLRKSKAKAIVDSSYNRFAWNDPSDLPDWFADDETRNYRPQLPVPAALVQKMKVSERNGGSHTLHPTTKLTLFHSILLTRSFRSSFIIALARHRSGSPA